MNKDANAKPAKKVSYVIILTIIIFLASCIAGEVSLRVYNYFNPVFIFYTDSYNRFRGKPFEDYGDFRLNSKGFNDLEFTPKKENTYRILGIGDSFAFGVVPYKYNYLTLLESQFNKKGVNIEVLNMGIPLTGPKEYLSVFVREGLALNPDMVLVSFFTGNDFVQSLEERKWYSRSYLATFINYFVNIHPQYKEIIRNKKGKYCDDCPTLNKDYYSRVEYKRGVACVRGAVNFESVSDEALSCLIQMRNICAKKGIALLVVIIPDEIQVNPAVQAQVRKTFYSNVPDDEWDVTLPNTVLAGKLKKSGIDYLDLYEYFAKESKQKALYKPRDTHWNIAGNQLAANVIQDYLTHYLILHKGGSLDIIKK